MLKMIKNDFKLFKDLFEIHENNPMPVIDITTVEALQCEKKEKYRIAKMVTESIIDRAKVHMQL